MRPHNYSDPWQAEKDRRAMKKKELIDRVIRCAKEWREWHADRPGTHHVTTRNLVEAAEALEPKRPAPLSGEGDKP